jgi:signal-transduction protein with cAMP-binding, CBS, and nucleotidyltransferase domain
MQEGDPHHERGTGCILVVEEKKLVGIVTERDLMQKVIGRDLNSDQVIVDEIMTESPDSLMIDDPIAFALNIMHFDKCRHVPLVDENQVPVGIVSSKDIVAYSAESLKMVTNQADGDE